MTRQTAESEFYDEMEVMPRQEREEYYNRRLREQVQYAYENSPAMRAKLDAAGIRPSDIRTAKDMEKIPVTTKDELIDLRKINPPWGGLVAVPPEKLARIYMSPGPIYDPEPIYDPSDRRLEKILYAMGFRKGDLVVNTYSYHMVPMGHLMDEGLRRLGCTVIPMGVGNTDLQVQVLRDMKVTGWVGAASFLVSILDRAEEMGYDARHDFSLRVARAGGEPAGGPIRKMLEERYGLIALDSYGTADVSGVAYECSQRSGMHILEEMFVEIVDKETRKQLGPGEIGEVVVTPFERTYPLVRFGTGDLASYTDEPCPCGRTSFRLSAILGRVGDAVMTRGMLVHPRQISDVVSRFPEISRYQAVVSRPTVRDELTLKIELANENADTSRLTSAVKETFSEICRVKVDLVEFVPRGTIPEDAKGIVDERVY